MTQSQRSDGLHPRARKLLDELQQMENMCRGTGLRFARSRIGSLADDMAANLTLLRDNLSNESAEVRNAAIQILLDQDRATLLDFVELAKGMILRDPDSFVKQAALHLLGMCFDGSKDHNIGKFLAGIVFDEGQESVIRENAYIRLVYLNNIERAPMAHKFRFPEDVDWTMVRASVMPVESEQK